jgi:hypothetical protein
MYYQWEATGKVDWDRRCVLVRCTAPAAQQQQMVASTSGAARTASEAAPDASDNSSAGVVPGAACLILALPLMICILQAL